MKAGARAARSVAAMSTAISPAALAELRFRLRGDLHEPGSPGYESACELFNAMIDIRPRLVARCATPADVVAALAFARDHDLPVSVRAGGHAVTGRALVEDGLVLDVRPMDDIVVDPRARRVRVGGGATWAAVDRATTAHGLATTGGRVSTTGVAGLTMGGGSGWLERKHGLACDNLLAVELVTADGRIVRADADENPDLLWALRGGGGNFGVVTALELALHPIPEQVVAGLAILPASRAREALECYRDVTERAPEELSLAFAAMPAPDDDEIPEHLRGEHCVFIIGMHAGSIADGEAAIAPIRALEPDLDAFAPTAYADFQCSIDDPPGSRNYWTAESVQALDAEVVDILGGQIERMPAGEGRAPQIFMAHWGGAVARATAEDSPLAARDSGYVVHPLLMWTDPADDEAMMAYGRGIRAALREHATGEAYANFLGDEGEDRVRAGYAPGAYERLAAIKAQWDPEDRFRANGHVRPAAAAVA